MPAGGAWMLRLIVGSFASVRTPVGRELWACRNLLTRFWVPLVHHRHGVEPLAVMRWL